jgi:RNA polymerase-interacting CarD/CdnL/TRCF family regulator
MFVVFYEADWDCDVDHITTVVCLTDSLDIARKVFEEMKLEDYMKYKAISEVEKDVVLLNGVDSGKIIAKENNEVFAIVCSDKDGSNLQVYETRNLDDAVNFFNHEHYSVSKVRQKQIVSSERGVLKTSNFVVY